MQHPFKVIPLRLFNLHPLLEPLLKIPVLHGLFLLQIFQQLFNQRIIFRHALLDVLPKAADVWPHQDLPLLVCNVPFYHACQAVVYNRIQLLAEEFGVDINICLIALLAVAVI